jgi:hypothetical protein
MAGSRAGLILAEMIRVAYREWAELTGMQNLKSNISSRILTVRPMGGQRVYYGLSSY